MNHSVQVSERQKILLPKFLHIVQSVLIFDLRVWLKIFPSKEKNERRVRERVLEKKEEKERMSKELFLGDKEVSRMNAKCIEA